MKTGLGNLRISIYRNGILAHICKVKRKENRLGQVQYFHPSIAFQLTSGGKAQGKSDMGKLKSIHQSMASWFTFGR